MMISFHFVLCFFKTVSCSFATHPNTTNTTLNNNNITKVMKIDVEGFELQVLRGAEQLLKNFNVWYIMLECNPDLIGGRKGQIEYLK